MIDRIMDELLKAGVKELKFVDKNRAVDQYGRTIEFHRTVENGYVNTSFRIL